jgi:hypothetical protein
LIKLLKALQHLLEGLGRVKEDSPFTIPQDELVDRFATLNLALAGPQATEEGFQIIVGNVTIGRGCRLENLCGRFVSFFPQASL